MLTAAIALRKAGLSVIWLKPKSKIPIGEQWADRDTMSSDDLKRTYVEGRNIGVRLGKWSRVDGFYLHVLDMDIRDREFEAEARRKVVELFDLKISDFLAVISGSGGASRHLYFLTDRPYRSKKLWHTKNKMLGPDGKEHWCAEIELFGTGKQVALPPSIHPSGKPYRWAAEEFYPEDLPVIEQDVLDEVLGEGNDEIAEAVEPVGMSLGEAEGILGELTDLGIDRETWRNVGMALKHEFGEDGWIVFDRWSKQQPEKYDRRTNKAQWQSFGKYRGRPFTMRSILKEVRDREDTRIVDEFDDADTDPVDIPEDDLRGETIPKHLLTVPGTLGLAVQHFNLTSIQTQPQFAVQAALALGSVVLGRYWCTDQDNYSSLYLVNLGPTGSGKEFGRKFLTKVLGEAGLGHLVGPNKYASEAGILSELAWKPRHVTVYDEFGRLLDSTRNSGNTNLRDAQTMLMSLFGLLDTEVRPTAYSTNGKSKEQIEAQRSMVVKRPAVTVLGLSTPETFFDALSQDDVANGFMNRLLVVNTIQPPKVEEPRRWKRIPEGLKRWISNYGSRDMNEMISGESPIEADDPEVVDFDGKAQARLREIAQEVIDLQAKYRPVRLDGLFSRSKEIAQRIALIVALSEDAQDIGKNHVDWAWDYVIFYTMAMIENARRMMGATPVQRVADHIAKVIRDAGEKGLSEYEMTRVSRDYQALDRRSRDEVLSRLKTDHRIVSPKPDSKMGRPTTRYVHVEFARKRE